MSVLFLIVFFLVAFLIVGLVLLQEGKGGGLTGMSTGMDGVMGAKNPLRRMTAYLFIIFVLLTLGINYYFHKRGDVVVPEGVDPRVVQELANPAQGPMVAPRDGGNIIVSADEFSDFVAGNQDNETRASGETTAEPSEAAPAPIDSDTQNKTSEAVSETVTAVMETAEAATETITETASDTLESMVDTVKATAEKAEAAVETVAETIEEAITEPAEAAVESATPAATDEATEPAAAADDEPIAEKAPEDSPSETKTE